MKKKEKKLDIKNQDVARGLFGPNDEYLRFVRDKFGVKIVARGSSVRFIGETENVDLAYNTIVELYSLYREKEFLTMEDVKSIVGIEVNNNSGCTVSLEKKQKKYFKAKSEGQQEYIDALMKYDVVFAIGPAGTGKTYLAVASAMRELREGSVRKIVLTRPAVEAGEKLGFLPGDYQAKVNPYLRPLYDALNSFLEFGQLKKLVENEIIEIVPLAYMRGRTLDDSLIILDEGQNTTIAQMKMFLTRMGNNSKIIVTGDITQIDLYANKTSGLIEIQHFLKDVPGIRFIYLTASDIVRHPLVQQIVDAFERYEKKSGRK